MIIGNKCDLEDQRAISAENGELFAKENGDMLFYETSAKESTNVLNGFTELSKKALHIMDHTEIVAARPR